MDPYQKQLQQLKPPSDADLDSDIARKKRLIIKLESDINDLSTYLSTLKLKNAGAVTMNRTQYDQFKLMKEAIAGLETNFNQSVKSIAEYRTTQMSEVDVEIAEKRRKIDDEIEKAQKKRQSAMAKLREANKLAYDYKKMIDSTALMQNVLKIDHKAVEDELTKIGVKKQQIDILWLKIDIAYKEAQKAMDQRTKLLAAAKAEKEKVDAAIQKVVNTEWRARKYIERKEADIKAREDKLIKEEEAQRVKKIQLNLRQASLQHLFDKLKKLQGGII